MARKSFKPEQIINKLREAEVLISQGAAVGEASRKIGVAEQTYYRWRREYNEFRPNGALGYRPPAPEAILVTCPPKTVPSIVRLLWDNHASRGGLFHEELTVQSRAGGLRHEAG